MTTLQEYYQALGYPRSRWHIGAEHPLLERYAIDLLGRMPRARVLEVGYQSGGFAVPVILAMRDRADFSYVGIDSFVYGSAVAGTVVAAYLERHGARRGYEFFAGDARAVLARLRGPFDLVLIDHDKRLYPRDLLTVLRRSLVSPEGSVLLHDVLGKARGVWPDCAAIADAFGYSASVVADIAEGLAVMRRTRDVEPGWRQRMGLLSVAVRIKGRAIRGTLGDCRRRLAGHAGRHPSE